MAELQKPLLPTEGSFDSYRRHEVRFMIAFAVFLIADWFYAYQQRFDPDENGTSKFVRHDWPDLVWAAGQTAGLLAMTSAKIDVNRYLGRNPKSLALLLLTWIAFYIAYACISWTGTYYSQAIPLYLAALPLLYAMVRFQHIVSMQPGALQLTQLFALALAFECLSHVGYYFHYLPSKEKGYTVPLIIFWLAAPLAVLGAYYYSRAKQENPTLCFNASVVIYLLLVGSGYLLDTVLSVAVDQDDDWVDSNDWAQRLVGPVHLIPTITMVLCRQQMHRRLGRWWLNDGTTTAEMVTLAACARGRCRWYARCCFVVCD
jgi:hypothetical protein